MGTVNRLLAVIGTMLALTVSIAELKPAGCKRLTAALHLSGDSFLLLGDTFVKLDNCWNQIETGSAFNVFRIPIMDAAFIWSKDYGAYAFQGKHYSYLWYDSRPFKEEYFGGSKFFKHGLDAAGDLNSRTVFFKGCKMVKTTSMGFTQPMDLPMGVPCNLDAALTVGEDLWLFKYDKLWKMGPTGRVMGSPVDISSVIHLNGIRLCEEGEEEDDYDDEE